MRPSPADDVMPGWLDNSYIIPPSMTEAFRVDAGPGEELTPVRVAPVDESEDQW